MCACVVWLLFANKKRKMYDGYDGIDGRIKKVTMNNSTN
jgi:hypothetical protein